MESGFYWVEVSWTNDIDEHLLGPFLTVGGLSWLDDGRPSWETTRPEPRVEDYSFTQHVRVLGERLVAPL